MKNQYLFLISLIVIGSLVAAYYSSRQKNKFREVNQLLAAENDDLMTQVTNLHAQISDLGYSLFISNEKVKDRERHLGWRE